MNPIQSAKTTGAHFVAAWLAATAVACTSPDVVDECATSGRPECHLDAGADAPKRDTPLPPDAPGPDTGISRSPLCGTMGCFPGNWSACGSTPVPDAAYAAFRAADDASDSNDDVGDATSDAGPDAQDGSVSIDADACLDGSHDGSIDVSIDGASPDAVDDATSEPAPDAPEDTAEDAPQDSDDGSPPSPDASTTDAGRSDTGFDIGTTDEPRPAQSCYIKPGATGVVTECAPVGPGAEGSACNDSHDCGLLLACVVVDQSAVCRPVYCSLPPQCLKGSYYQEAPLRVNGVTRPDIYVPVCLPVDNCKLLTPDACPAGKACAVVGSEGETACMEPGTAKAGENCDDTSRCAEGLLCSKFNNLCVRICRVDLGGADCPTGTCQGGNRSLPDGFGICVGQTDGG